MSASLSLQLSARSGVPRYRQVVEQIADQIRAGLLTPGTRLPSVRELSVQLSLSLITVRRAYAELESAGLVDRRQGQGTFVAEAVGAAVRRQAADDAVAALQAAVVRARTLGLTDDEIVAVVKHATRRTS